MAESKIPRGNSFQNNAQIPTSTDLNTLKTPGIYYSGGSATTATLLNVPSGITEAFPLLVIAKGPTVVQIIFARSFRIYLRIEYSGGFGSWYVFEGTAVT